MFNCVGMACCGIGQHRRKAAIFSEKPVTTRQMTSSYHKSGYDTGEETPRESQAVNLKTIKPAEKLKSHQPRKTPSLLNKLTNLANPS